MKRDVNRVAWGLATILAAALVVGTGRLFTCYGARFSLLHRTQWGFGRYSVYFTDGLGPIVKPEWFKLGFFVMQWDRQPTGSPALTGNGTGWWSSDKRGRGSGKPG